MYQSLHKILFKKTCWQTDICHKRSISGPCKTGLRLIITNPQSQEAGSSFCGPSCDITELVKSCVIHLMTKKNVIGMGQMSQKHKLKTRVYHCAKKKRETKEAKNGEDAYHTPTRWSYDPYHTLLCSNVNPKKMSSSQQYWITQDWPALLVLYCVHTYVLVESFSIEFIPL